MSESLPKRLKIIRKKLLLNQKQFAELLGIEQAHYSRIENGKTQLSIKYAEVLKLKYGISPEWLLFGTGEDPFGNSSDAGPSPDTENERFKRVIDLFIADNPDYTLKKIAAEAGLDYTHLSAMRAGTKPVGLIIVRKLNQTLGMNPRYVLEAKGEPFIDKEDDAIKTLKRLSELQHDRIKQLEKENEELKKQVTKLQPKKRK